MSPLAKQVIDVLGKEEDNNLLAEVLDFYGYLKAKKRKEEEIKWQVIITRDLICEFRGKFTYSGLVSLVMIN